MIVQTTALKALMNVNVNVVRERNIKKMKNVVREKKIKNTKIAARKINIKNINISVTGIINVIKKIYVQNHAMKKTLLIVLKTIVKMGKLF
jgi:dihydroxyacetone kinase-like predicted kinase